jgi:tRNA(fMet)-specific endonuclease VapC
LHERNEFFARWTVLQWDAATADLFLNLRRQGVRIGSMDLKIACIALVHNGTLLTRNTSDFARVPGLRVEDWTQA